MDEAYGALLQDGTLDMASVQKHWSEVIERHEKKRLSWLQRCEKIVKIYADADTSGTKNVQRKYCVLWANTQTRMPAIYSRPPKCVVSRRYQTASQPVRNSVLALERATNIQIGDGKLHEAIMSARLDRLLAGRGTIWARYKAEDSGTEVQDQRVLWDFVGFKDFGHGEARTWEEVDCVWRRTYMSKEELAQRFGDDVRERCSVTLDYAEKDAPDGMRQASVYEIWCKSRKAVYWIARSAAKALDVGPPPLNLKNFWPCPKPAFGTLTNENCIPTPDFIYYQDQADEITRLTRRIDKLTDQLKLVGFYPAGPSTEGRSEIERALQPGVENKLIPVPSWAAFAEKGGANQIQYLPVRDVAFIIESCVKLRQQLLMDVDQITGTSDIMRGETDPNETLGAQQLKSQYGSQRLRDTKDDFVRFAKEACEITAEIVAENFTDQSLVRMTTLPAVDQDPQTQQPVPAQWLALLRNQFVRDVLIDVETDSTVQPDEDAEKQRRVEFMGVLSQAAQQIITVGQLEPQIAAAVLPLMGDALTFTVRGFRAGRELEERIESTMQQLTQMLQQKAAQPPQPPAQDPRVAVQDKKVEADTQLGHRALDIKEFQAVKDAEAKMVQAQRPQVVRPTPAA